MKQDSLLLEYFQSTWKPCKECAPSCWNCMDSDADEDSYSMTCQCCVNHNNYRPRFKYCSGCGRPLTAEAYDELADHIKKSHLDGWLSVKDCLPEESQDVKKFSEPHFEMCSVIACGKMSGGLGWIVKETNRYVSHKTGVEYIDSITTNAGREFDKWYWADGWECVTHWMPLPSLPEVTI